MPKFEHVSSVYGALFPAKPDQLDFLQRSLPAGAPPRWVDVACGPGHQMEGLSGRGLQVWGLDLESKMVQQLVERVPSLAPRVVVADMRDADRALASKLPGPAGVVYCIGNSLVQLTDLADQRRMLRACKRLLGADGALVLQIVNFDRVLAGDFRLLPRIDRPLEGGGTLSLERWYENSLHDGCLEFHTRVTTPDGVEERAHEIRALAQRELDDLLEESGYAARRWYGDYREQPWQPESPATIVRAQLIATM